MRRETFAALQSLESRRLFAAGVSSTEVLASFSSAKGLSVVQDYLKKRPTAALGSYVDLKHSKQLFKTGSTSLVQVRIAKGGNVDGAIKLLKKVPGVRWASPNYVYGKATPEATPTDPKYASQADALKQIGLDAAWAVTTGSAKLTVAVIDDGFDATHEDLQNVLWTNPGEIAGDGLDNDANGYADDVNGYDVVNGDKDFAPAYDKTYGFTDSHGTQVASVIAANANNGMGFAGVAHGVKIMPVRFRGADAVVTSAGIASSVAYAVNNGARIINLSYSFDPYMTDPAFTAAVDLAYSKGVLWVNSAGNNNVANPPRTTLDKILFVDNVDNADVRNPNSNYGSATDLSAPGTNVLAAAPGNAYYPVDGTSFSAAVTSGIAALVWSAHPTWTRDQVAARLLNTADPIDAKNPGFEGQLGVGRINAGKALTAAMVPTLRGLVGIADGSSVSTSPATLSLGTLSVLDPSTITAGAFELRGAGVDGKFDTADDTLATLAVAGNYAYGSNKIDLSVGQTLASGKYRFTAKTTIADPFGAKLATPYVATFTLNPQAPTPPTNVTVTTPTYSQTEAELRWTDASTNETGFVVERSTSATFATIDKTYTAAANSTRFNDWGLSMGTTYYYRVRATNAVGVGVASNTATLVVALPPAGVPATPTGLTVAVAAGTGTEAVLKWTDTATNETGFVIQRSTSATFATIEKSFTAIAGSNQYYDWGLASGTTYYYRIQAVNGPDASAWSNTATLGNPNTPAPTPIPSPPVAPATLAVKAIAGAKATLTWADKSDNETGFVVERSLTSTFGLLVSTIGVAKNATTLADSGLIAGLTYYYRVRATNAVGPSAWSNVVAVKAVK